MIYRIKLKKKIMARKHTSIGMVPPSILKARAYRPKKNAATAKRKPFKKAKASGLKKKKGRAGN